MKPVNGTPNAALHTSRAALKEAFACLLTPKPDLSKFESYLGDVVHSGDITWITCVTQKLCALKSKPPISKLINVESLLHILILDLAEFIPPNPQAILRMRVIVQQHNFTNQAKIDERWMLSGEGGPWSHAPIVSATLKGFDDTVSSLLHPDGILENIQALDAAVAQENVGLVRMLATHGLKDQDNQNILVRSMIKTKNENIFNHIFSLVHPWDLFEKEFGRPGLWAEYPVVQEGHFKNDVLEGVRHHTVSPDFIEGIDLWMAVSEKHHPMSPHASAQAVAIFLGHSNILGRAPLFRARLDKQRIERALTQTLGSKNDTLHRPKM